MPGFTAPSRRTSRDERRHRDPGEVSGGGGLGATRADTTRDDAEDAMPSALDRIGRFRIRGRLGSGGMSVVYEADDPRVQRRVALKLLRGRDGTRRPERLRREAQALASLSHPNIVEVYEAGTHEGRAFLVMELLPGRSLQRWLAHAERTVPEIVATLVEAGRGLAAAHGQGLLHRDFKPSNVLVGDDGRVRVFDFGLATPIGGHAEGPESGATIGTTPDGVEPDASHSGLWGASLTRTGAMLGTPAYLSPEQFEGRPATAASDQFAFCVTLYEALYGEHPFVERSSWEQLAQHVMEGRVREPSGGRLVPRALHEVIVRGLSVHPSSRWPSVAALLVAIERAMGQRRRRWRAARWTMGALAVGGALLGWGIGAPPAELACARGVERIDEVWGPEPRAAVAASLRRADRTRAAQVGSRVEARIDEYAQRWRDEYRWTCARGEHAADERGPGGGAEAAAMDGRMRCLDRRRRELGALVDVLADADAGMVGEALGAVSALEPSEACREHGASRRAVAHVADGELARAVASHRSALGRARALERAGNYREAMRVAQRVLDAADALGFEPLRAEAHAQAGRLHLQRGEHEAAVAALERAYFLAEALEHDEVAFDAANFLVMTHSMRLRRPDEGLRWAKHAEAVAARLGGPRIEARVARAHAIALWGAERLEASLARFEAVLPRYERQWGAEHPEVAGIHNNIGLLQRDLGRLDRAMVHIRRAVAISELALGTEHPSVARTLNNLGIVQFLHGRVDEAIGSIERAYRLRRRALGPEHPDVARPLSNLANLLGTQGRLSEAIGYAQQALAIHERGSGEPSLSEAYVRQQLSMLWLQRGRAELAAEQAEAAVRITEQAVGMESSELVMPLMHWSQAEFGRGRMDDALEHAQRSVVLAERHAWTAVMLGPCRLALARARWELGDRVGAWDQAQLARHAYEHLDASNRVAAAGDIERLHAWLQAHPEP